MQPASLPRAPPFLFFLFPGTLRLFFHFGVGAFRVSFVISRHGNVSAGSSGDIPHGCVFFLDAFRAMCAMSDGAGRYADAANFGFSSEPKAQPRATVQPTSEAGHVRVQQHGAATLTLFGGVLGDHFSIRCHPHMPCDVLYLVPCVSVADWCL